MSRRVEDLAGVYSQIADELTRQYVIGYLPQGGTDGGWRNTSVRVRRPGHHARTRSGYYSSPNN
jgi:hypothetical protein